MYADGIDGTIFRFKYWQGLDKLSVLKGHVSSVVQGGIRADVFG